MISQIKKLYKKIKNYVICLRLNDTPIPSIIVNTIFYSIVYIILPVNKPFYKNIKENMSYYYPHIRMFKPAFFDPIRIIIQTLFLIVTRQNTAQEKPYISNVYSLIHKYSSKLFFNPAISVFTKFTSRLMDLSHINWMFSGKKLYWLATLLICIAFFLVVLCITQPLDLTYQFIFVAIMWVIASVLRNVPNRLTLLILIFISFIVASRYLWWRITSTVIIETPTTAICSLLLITAEIYSFIVMVLSYFQVCWVLDRKPYPLPKDEREWPSVDIMIPSYNEPLDVVKPCLLAASDIDWPKEKLNVYVLDDGSRPEFQRFAEEIGIGYIKREKHDHAKAGNINHALTVTHGDLIAIFDCDHIPVRAFLQMTVGWMVYDKKIALVQTPHHFYSEDPFEKNLHLNGKIPSENSLFHDFIQKGNDMWNATMFCGSCAVIRRKPLEEIGGIAIETVTEDAHTSLRLNQRGYNSAFISIPLAAGLSTESLADHINQRIRWARGMVQIFRVDNPLLMKGLTFAQRICFTNAMIHFLHGIPRIIFLLAPLPYLFGNIYVIFASGLAILAYVFPYMLHSTITNRRIQGNRRFFFWGAIYETILSWYITVPTLVALIAPSIGKFNVTAKGASNEKTYFDWSVSKSYMFLMFLNIAGLLYGIYKICFDPYAEVFTILVNLGWVCYNLLILGAATSVALEIKQVRNAPRVSVNLPVNIEFESGHCIQASVSNFSKDGLGIKLPTLCNSDVGWDKMFDGCAKFNVIFLNSGDRFLCQFCRLENDYVGARVILGSKEESITYVRNTFASSDRWVSSENNLMQDSLLNGIEMLLKVGLNGYKCMINYAPSWTKPIRYAFFYIISFILSFLPRPIKSLDDANDKSNG